MKGKKVIVIGLIAATVAIIWYQVKASKEKKEVEGLKDKELANTGKPTLATPGIVQEGLGTPADANFVSQPLLNYVDELNL